MVRTGLLRREPQLRAITTEKAASAPTKAPAQSAPVPLLLRVTMTMTAPTDAPDDVPRMYGSASGLASTACITVPANASPAPQSAANTARGSRRSHTMLLATTLGWLRAPRWWRRTLQTWSMGSHEGPMARAISMET